MSNDPLELAQAILEFLVAHENAMDEKGTTITGLVAHVEKSKRLVSLLEQRERDGVWRWSAPVMLERVAPDPRMKSVTVTVNFEE